MLLVLLSYPGLHRENEWWAPKLSSLHFLLKFNCLLGLDFDGIVLKCEELPCWSDLQSHAIFGTTAVGSDSCCSTISPQSSVSWTCGGDGGKPAHPWTRHTASGQNQLQARTNNTCEALLVMVRQSQSQHEAFVVVRGVTYIPIAFPSSLVDPVKILGR